VPPVPAPVGVGTLKAKTGNLCECGAGRDDGTASVDMELTAAEEEAIRSVTLQDEDGELTYVSHRALEPDRQSIMAKAFPDCAPGANKVVAITAGNAAGTKKECIALLPLDGSEGTPRVVFANCQITYEDLSPSECIEYTFADAPDDWTMTQLSLEALENYRSQKFGELCCLNPHAKRNSGRCYRLAALQNSMTLTSVQRQRHKRRRTRSQMSVLGSSLSYLTQSRNFAFGTPKLSPTWPSIHNSQAPHPRSRKMSGGPVSSRSWKLSMDSSTSKVL